MEDDVKKWTNFRVHNSEGAYINTLFFVDGKMKSGRELDILMNK